MLLAYVIPEWLFSPYIHKGPGHVASNSMFLGMFGRLVEPVLGTRRYFVWFVLVEMTITPVWGLVKVATHSESLLVVFGINGFVVSLAVYVTLILNRGGKTELDLIGVILGIVSGQVAGGLFQGSGVPPWPFTKVIFSIPWWLIDSSVFEIYARRVAGETYSVPSKFL